MIAMVLAALQGAGSASTLPTCSLVAPRGDSIGFVIWAADNPDEIRLSPTSGSAWPVRTVIGTRQQGKSGIIFAIGGRPGLMLALAPGSEGRQREVTLYTSDRDGEPLPAAYGFCEERAPASAPEEPGVDRNAVARDNPAFESSLWPEDCALILSDGGRLRFDFTVVPSDQVRLVSPELWSGRPLTTTIRWTTSNGVQTATFGRPGGPEGVQLFFVRGSQGVKLIRFHQLAEPSAPNLTAYGICGYKQMVRRPTSEPAVPVTGQGRRP